LRDGTERRRHLSGRHAAHPHDAGDGAARLVGREHSGGKRRRKERIDEQHLRVRVVEDVGELLD
jgi:hypothetical protein